MRWNCLVLLGGATVLLGSVGLGTVGQQGKGPHSCDGVAPNAKLGQILGERVLLGKDFPTALGYLPNWKRLGERKVAVYPHHMVGTPCRRLGKARQAAARLDSVLGKSQPHPKLGRAAVINVAPMHGDSPMTKGDQDREKVRSQEEPRTEQEILEYWTQKRKDEAKPLPIPTPPPRSAEGGQRSPDEEQGK